MTILEHCKRERRPERLIIANTSIDVRLTEIACLEQAQKDAAYLAVHGRSQMAAALAELERSLNGK